MNIIEKLAPIIADGARSGIKMTKCIGVTVHNTDNWSKGAGAINHGTYLQNGGASQQTSWHYAVDDTCAVRSIPENEIAWHAGDGGTGKGNSQTVAVEICVNPDSDLAKATDNAARLVAEILKRKRLSASAVYQHHDWMDKNCPSQLRAGKPYSWETFKKKVAEYYGGTSVPVDKPSQSKPTESKTKYAIGTPVCVNVIAGSSDGTAGVHKGDWQGTITKIVPGAKYPYLINDGNIGWTNDAAIDSDPHIPGNVTTSKPASSSIKVGDWVGVKTGAKDYNGKAAAGVVRGKIYYTADELKGDRAVLDIPGICTAFHTKDLFN